MIIYKKGTFVPSSLLRIRGGVFFQAMPSALFCGLLGFFFKLLSKYDPGAEYFFSHVLSNNSAYSSVSVMIGFLVIFRTQQSYSRFWEGARHIKSFQSELFVTGSNLLAFTRASKAEKEKIEKFHNVLVRLLSVLHAVALSKLHGHASVEAWLDVIDLQGLDANSLDTLWQEKECKVELLLQWVQSLTVDAIGDGVLVIAPPILSRIFQNLSNGLSAFNNAYRLVEVPYPFPYMQTTELLLLMHCIVTPMVMCDFTVEPAWTGVFSFLVAIILLSLNKIASELEDPYGNDYNDLDLNNMQEELNLRLLMLMRSSTRVVPKCNEHSMCLSGTPRDARKSIAVVDVEHIKESLEGKLPDAPPKRFSVRVDHGKEVKLDPIAPPLNSTKEASSLLTSATLRAVAEQRDREASPREGQEVDHFWTEESSVTSSRRGVVQPPPVIDNRSTASTLPPLKETTLEDGSDFDKAPPIRPSQTEKYSLAAKLRAGSKDVAAGPKRLDLPRGQEAQRLRGAQQGRGQPIRPCLPIAASMLGCGGK